HRSPKRRRRPRPPCRDAAPTSSIPRRIPMRPARLVRSGRLRRRHLWARRREACRSECRRRGPLAPRLIFRPPPGRRRNPPMRPRPPTARPPMARRPRVRRPAGAPPAAGALPPPTGALPAPPPRNPNATGGALATLPPSATPRDEFDLAYGYVLRKDYALAEQGFRDFLKRYPGDARASDANYWLGETFFQRQKYRDAAEVFLLVSRDHPTTAKAPDALLRLGQSLAQLGEQAAACGTLAEVGRKYPRAALSVRQAVEREQKRVHC